MPAWITAAAIWTSWISAPTTPLTGKEPLFGLCQIRFTDGVIKPYVVAMFPLSSDGLTVDQCLAVEDLELDLLEVDRLPPSVGKTD